MPRVGVTKKFRIDGKNVDFTVYYNQKKRFHIHYKEFPLCILGVCGGNDLPSGETEQALETEIDRLLTEYKHLTQKKTRVIAFWVNLTDSLVFKNGTYFRQGWLKRNLKIQGDLGEGIGMTIDYKVIYKVKSAGNITYHSIDDSENDSGKLGYEKDVEGAIIIDWTPQREAWFKNFEGAMTKFIKGLVSMISKKKDFEKLIDTNVRLLK